MVGSSPRGGFQDLKLSGNRVVDQGKVGSAARASQDVVEAVVFDNLTGGGESAGAIQRRLFGGVVVIESANRGKT